LNLDGFKIIIRAVGTKIGTMPHIYQSKKRAALASRPP